MMKKIIFIGLILLLSLGGFVGRAQERSVTELRKLVAPGNKVAVVFKDFSGDQYHWERDAAQRKIMLKIREKRPDAVFSRPNPPRPSHPGSRGSSRSDKP